MPEKNGLIGLTKKERQMYINKKLLQRLNPVLIVCSLIQAQMHNILYLIITHEVLNREAQHLSLD